MLWMDRHNPNAAEKVRETWNKPGKCTGKYCMNPLPSKCLHRAEQLLAVHSAYDIPISNWVQIFEQTGAIKATLVMYLPVELVAKAKTMHGFYDIEIEGDTAMFTFPGDTSLGYVHSVQTWREYITTDVIRGAQFNILIERVKYEGPQCTMTLTRITKPVHITRTLYPFSDKIVRVPNALKIFETRHYDPEDDILADKEQVEKLQSYIIALDSSQFNTKVIYSYVRAMGTGVKIGNTVRNSAWRIPMDEMMQITERCIHIAIVQRMRMITGMCYVTNEMHHLVKTILESEHVDLHMAWINLTAQRNSQKVWLYKCGKAIGATTMVGACLYIGHQIHKGKLQLKPFSNPCDIIFKIAGSFRKQEKTIPERFMANIDKLEDSVTNCFRNPFHHVNVADFNIKRMAVDFNYHYAVEMSEFSTVSRDDMLIKLPFKQLMVACIKSAPKYLMNKISENIYIALSLSTFALPYTVYRLFNKIHKSLISKRDMNDPLDLDIIRIQEVKTSNRINEHKPDYVVRHNGDFTIYEDAMHKFEMALLNAKEEPFKSMSEAVYQLIHTRVPGVPPKTTLITGPPGSGKTKWVHDNFKANEVLILVPTRKLAMDYAKAGYEARTYHKFFLNPIEQNKLIIDEAFTFPESMLKTIEVITNVEEIIYMGDPHQIGFIDFENVFNDDENPTKWLLTKTLIERKTTYRCPHDITHILNTIYGYANINTASIIEHSMYEVDFLPNEGQNIVYTQKAKEHYGAITVHEAQGATYPLVNLILTSDSQYLIKNSDAHNIVAISRHTKELRIVKIKGEQLVLPTMFTTEFLNTLGMLELQPPVDYTHPSHPLMVMENVDSNDYQPAKIYGTDACDEEFNLIVQPHIDYETTTRLDMDEPEHVVRVREPRNGFETELELLEKWRMKGNVYDHTTWINNKSFTLHTMLARYSSFSRQYSQNVRANLIQETKRNFMRAFLDEDRFKKVREFDIDNLAYHTHEQFQRMMDKKTVEQIRTLEPVERQQWLTDFFLKQQSKVRTPEGGGGQSGEQKGKAGQGVSAWDKVWNASIGPYIRDFSERLRMSFREEVYIVNGMHDIPALSNLLTEDFATATFTETDITEFDAGQDAITLGVEIELMRSFNVPDIIVELYECLRTAWKMSARDLAWLQGEYKQHSGQPATLMGNSIVTLMILANTMRNVDKATVLVKGDDGLLLYPQGIDATEDALKMTTHNINHKLKLKIVKGRAPQFINFFMTQEGPVPDIVRMAMKVKSKPISVTLCHIKESSRVHIYNGKPRAHLSVYTTDSTDQRRTFLDIILNEYVCIGIACEIIQADGRETIPIHLTCQIKNRWAFRAIASITGKRISIFCSPEPHAFTSYQQSIRDRIKPLKDPRKVAHAYACAAQYYDLRPEEIEKIHGWLYARAHEHEKDFAYNYVKMHRAIIAVEMPVKTKETIRYEDDQFTYSILNLGSTNNDCWDRVLTALTLNAVLLPISHAQTITEQLNITNADNDLMEKAKEYVCRNFRKIVPHGKMVPLEIALLTLKEWNLTCAIAVPEKTDNTRIIVYSSGTITPVALLNNGHYYLINNYMKRSEYDQEEPFPKDRCINCTAKVIPWPIPAEATEAQYQRYWQHTRDEGGKDNQGEELCRDSDSGRTNNTDGTQPYDVSETEDSSGLHVMAKLSTNEDGHTIHPIPEPDERSGEHLYLCNDRPQIRETKERPRLEDNSNSEQGSVILCNIAEDVCSTKDATETKCVLNRRRRRQRRNRVRTSGTDIRRSDISRQEHNQLRGGVGDTNLSGVMPCTTTDSTSKPKQRTPEGNLADQCAKRLAEHIDNIKLCKVPSVREHIPERDSNADTSRSITEIASDKQVNVQRNTGGKDRHDTKSANGTDTNMGCDGKGLETETVPASTTSVQHSPNGVGQLDGTTRRNNVIDGNTTDDVVEYRWREYTLQLSRFDLERNKADGNTHHSSPLADRRDQIELPRCPGFENHTLDRNISNHLNRITTTIIRDNSKISGVPYASGIVRTNGTISYNNGYENIKRGKSGSVIKMTTPTEFKTTYDQYARLSTAPVLGAAFYTDERHRDIISFSVEAQQKVADFRTAQQRMNIANYRFADVQIVKRLMINNKPVGVNRFQARFIRDVTTQNRTKGDNYRHTTTDESTEESGGDYQVVHHRKQGTRRTVIKIDGDDNQCTQGPKQNTTGTVPNKSDWVDEIETGIGSIEISD
uniref:Replicase n=1 Tax=Riboviria sp. TaxID=2585031 RepID=A0A6M3YNW0_9VIRU|nr:MAG: replicase [Riboviria sp.]